MNDPEFDPDSEETSVPPHAGMRAILEWLDTPPPSRATEDLSSLYAHLVALGEAVATPPQRTNALDRLYARSMTAIDRLLPTLIDAQLPVPRKTRQMVRNMQEILLLLTTQLHTSASTLDEHLIRGLRRPPELIFWRCLSALSRHLLISYLVTSPAAIGVWQLAHETYTAARRQRLANKTPSGESSTLQHVYYSAVLMGCAQPASFTPQEINFIASYLERFADHVEPLTEENHAHSGLFWIDPARDAPAFAWARKPPAPKTPVIIFSCDRLASLLREQLAALDNGQTPQQMGLPALAGSAAGRGVLRRLASYWGNPLKRRFQRRRQNYRAVLCSGLDNLWQLLQEGHAAAAEVSSWMITNESPDGYALMHVSGKTGKLLVGDVTAVRTESGSDWQICIARWALSENPEHFELGLQVLGPRAEPGLLVLPSENGEAQRIRVLCLPSLPPLRSAPTLIAPADCIPDKSQKLILLLEQGKIEIREIRITRLEEQTANIEAFTIQPDAGN